MTLIIYKRFIDNRAVKERLWDISAALLLEMLFYWGIQITIFDDMMSPAIDYIQWTIENANKQGKSVNDIFVISENKEEK